MSSKKVATVSSSSPSKTAVRKPLSGRAVVAPSIVFSVLPTPPPPPPPPPPSPSPSPSPKNETAAKKDAAVKKEPAPVKKDAAFMKAAPVAKKDAPVAKTPVAAPKKTAVPAVKPPSSSSSLSSASFSSTSSSTSSSSSSSSSSTPASKERSKVLTDDPPTTGGASSSESKPTKTKTTTAAATTATATKPAAKRTASASSSSDAGSKKKAAGSTGAARSSQKRAVPESGLKEELSAAPVAKRARAKGAVDILLKDEPSQGNHWWEGDQGERGEGVRWNSLSHNGVHFPPEYEPHGVPVLFKGKPVKLDGAQEEYATYFARYLKTPHMDKRQFSENFWKDWKELLKGKPQGAIITNFKDCDFSRIWDHLEEQKAVRKGRSKEDKDREKAEKEALQAQYGFAVLDGVKERIGNFSIEPPGLFLGRGDHPQAGRFKRRIHPEDVTLNLGEEAAVPPPPAGHKWKEIVHNHSVCWLALWHEKIRGDTKYVWLHSGSRLKGESDISKFDIARQLSSIIRDVRQQYMKELSSEDTKSRQLATALWLIDHLALRVGNEKGDDQADTVGCCSLRVEHVTALKNNRIRLKFLGKDSMQYDNTFAVHPAIYSNISDFCADKDPEEDLFHLITTIALNKYLKSFMPKLTAKVFRTYNASITLERELSKIRFSSSATVQEKVLEFNRANRAVAVLCNHQRSLPPTHHNQVQKIDDEVQSLIDKLKELEEHAALLQRKGGNPSPNYKYWRSDDQTDLEGGPKRTKLPAKLERAQVLTQQLNDRIKSKLVQKAQKNELATIALGTSKMNYIDPRLPVRWCIDNQVPISKIFSKTLREKFAWAIHFPGIEAFQFGSPNDTTSVFSES